MARVWLSALVTVAFLLPSLALAWTCEETGSRRLGPNTIEACGVAEAETEEEARASAYGQAKREFEMICNDSANCRGRDFNVNPKRSTCSKGKKTYKCYRAIEFQILEAKKDKDSIFHDH